MIRIIHNSVKGRIRFHVSDLYRNGKLQSFLNSELRGVFEDSQISSSILTGNVLIIFPPSCNPRLIVSALEQAVSSYHLRFPDRQSASSEYKKSHVIKGLSKGLGKPEMPMPGTCEIPSGSSEWWKRDFQEALIYYGVRPDVGLTGRMVEINSSRFGANTASKSASRSSISILLDQFTSLPIILLAIGAGVSAITGGLMDAVVIAIVILINGAIGYVTESQTEKTISALTKLVRPVAEVLRDGEQMSIRADEVVCGDILLLKPGHFVTADARLVEAEHLSVDESILTGESLPANKTVQKIFLNLVPIGERSNMIFAGSRISGGQGKALVVAVGSYTEIGRISSLVSEAVSPETPIEKQLNAVGNQLTALSGIVCALVFFLGLYRGAGFIEMLKMGISLAVAAVPEGLPAVATTTLALGVKNMRRHGVLVRNLDAVCAIGSVQTICFDKTGTVTLNHMTVTLIHVGETYISCKNGGFFVNGADFNPYSMDELIRLLHVGLLCSETQVERENGGFRLIGSPTENALVSTAIAVGVDVHAVRNQHPLIQKSYRAENQLYMRTVHQTGSGEYLVAIKGSPLEVISKCDKYLKDGLLLNLDEDVRDEIEYVNERMAGQSLRVLGLAYFSSTETTYDISCGQWTWLGLVGMEDPIRDGVKDSIKQLHAAGLDTVMITGDQGPTAFAVGKQLDLSRGKALEIVDATDLSSNNPAILRALCEKANVFSRVSPADKLHIVRSIQTTGRVVAVAGDGINDGPALKAADIGIAMGASGTDVAREVADIVLEHDDLETLIIALSDGRTIYNNIRKALHYLLATNFSEIIVMSSSSAIGLGYPLSAIQLLWINLISDVLPGLALAMEPAEPDVLSKKPRSPQEPIVTNEDYREIAVEAGIISLSSLLSYGYGVAKYGIGPTAGVFCFQSLTIAQILHALSCRFRHRSVLQQNDSPSNNFLSLAVFGSLSLQALTQLIPGLRGLLGLTAISPADFAVIGASSVLPFVINETRKINLGSSLR